MAPFCGMDSLTTGLWGGYQPPLFSNPLYSGSQLFAFLFSFFCLCFLSYYPPFPSLSLILYYPFVPFLLTPPLASLPELAGLKQSLHLRHTEATLFIGKGTARLPTSDVGMFRGLPSQWLIHPGWACGWIMRLLWGAGRAGPSAGI